jgi:GNAT superfamily N-acetyltransferase
MAGSQDIATLCKLYFEFHEFFVGKAPNRHLSLGPPDSFDASWLSASLEKILSQADAVIFVAEVGEQVVGLAEAYLRSDEPRSDMVSYKYGYLQSLMVQEMFRGHGLGTQLLEAVQQWAKEKEAAEIRLDVYEFAEGPLPFYELQGYRTLHRMLVRGL